MQKYKSLGQMLKKQDFEYLFDDLNKMLGTDEFKSLIKKDKDSNISELDELLFNIPSFCLDKEKKLIPKSSDVLKFCLDNGANPMAYMKNGENTFLRLCGTKDSTLLDLLISTSPDIDMNVTDGRCNSALFYAVQNEAVDNIKKLVTEYGFDVNHKNIISEEQTVLHYACGHILENSIKTLLELGADLSIKDSCGRTPHDMMGFINDPDVREEYSDEPDTLKKWDEVYASTSKLTNEKLSSQQRRLKKQY